MQVCSSGRLGGELVSQAIGHVIQVELGNFESTRSLLLRLLTVRLWLLFEALEQLLHMGGLQLNILPVRQRLANALDRRDVQADSARQELTRFVV